MNVTKDYFMTVIVPVFNERDNMQRLEEELIKYLKTARLASCILFVDDGSTDGSTQMIKDVCARNKDMFYLSFEKNCGNSAAMKAGIDHAQSTYVGYIDADLQTTPDDFNLLAEYADKYTLVTGIRANRKDTFAKRIQSKIGNAFRRMMTGDDAKNAAFLRVAPLCPRLDSPSERNRQASPYPPLPPDGRQIEIHHVEPADRPVQRLLRLPLDEEPLYQL